MGRKALNRMQDCDYKCHWYYAEDENQLCDGPAASHQLSDGKMVHKMPDIIPLLIRGIKRCSIHWSRQYFPLHLKLYSKY